MNLSDFLNYVFDMDLTNEWFVRWLALLVAPLGFGLVFATVVVVFFGKDAGSRRSDPVEGKPPTPDIAAGLTFVGAFVTGIGNLKVEYLVRDGKVNEHDLAVLFAANIVFTGLAAMYVVAKEFPNGKIARRASALVLAGAIATLSSLGVMIWRVSYEPPQELPGFIRLVLTVALLAAAAFISIYVRQGLPKREGLTEQIVHGLPGAAAGALASTFANKATDPSSGNTGIAPAPEKKVVTGPE